jgi:hypothetical protein
MPPFRPFFRLVGRLPDSPSKAEQYSALGLAREAAEVAARIKVRGLLLPT